MNTNRQDFIRSAQLLLRDEYEAFEAALETEPPVSIRMNPAKTVPGLFAEMKQIPWCKTGYYLPERPSFTFDPLFHAGVYYVQDASSMFLEQAVRTVLADPALSKKPITALDLCAAPGGKSTHLLSLLPQESLLLCNEVIRSRSMILAENIAKWGHSDTMITQSDPQQFGQAPHSFDLIVADLPCSGEGLFRKEPAARDEWSFAHVQLCSARQRRIIYDVWPALKPGGYLIYSTCTFNTEENEDNIKTLCDELGAEVAPIAIHPEWNISGARRHAMPVYRFFPHRTRGEGFFLALIQKTITNYELRITKRRQTERHRACSNDRCAKEFFLRSEKITNRRSDLVNNEHSKFQPIPCLKELLTQSEKFVLQQRAGFFSAFPRQHENAFATLSGCLNIVSAGLPLGEMKGIDFIPSAALSLSTELHKQAYPMVELSYEQAITYLQRKTITLPANEPKGYLIVTFKNIPLGFVKNIGSRANNLYPKEWRILSTNYTNYHELS
jgi:16S rRNA C967 or C1407 C5-methylase (RsmB/RsmF family)/NOL1/NOP2/fmu family ribosome biogenesis protein